jgi:DNA-directed RNA polymerase subunit F
MMFIRQDGQKTQSKESLGRQKMKKEFLKEYENIPNAIFEVEKTLITKQMQLETNSIKLEAHKGTIFVHISREKDQMNKLVYSNEKAREYALKCALANDEKYNEVIEEWGQIKSAIELLKAELNKLNMIYKTRTILIKYQTEIKPSADFHMEYELPTNT